MDQELLQICKAQSKCAEYMIKTMKELIASLDTCEIKLNKGSDWIRFMRAVGECKQIISEYEKEKTKWTTTN